MVEIVFELWKLQERNCVLIPWNVLVCIIRKRRRASTWLFFNIMLPHTDDLITRPYEIVTTAISYGWLIINSSVWRRTVAISDIGLNISSLWLRRWRGYICYSSYYSHICYSSYYSHIKYLRQWPYLELTIPNRPKVRPSCQVNRIVTSALGVNPLCSFPEPPV